MRELTLKWSRRRQAILDRLSGDLSIYSNGDRCYMLHGWLVHLSRS